MPAPKMPTNEELALMDEFEKDLIAAAYEAYWILVGLAEQEAWEALPADVRASRSTSHYHD
jgi:hypothetical protein